MARVVALSFALVALVVFGTGVAQGPPQHPHMLVLGLELDADDNPVAYRKCVDLAANRALPNNAHHDNLHFGRAGEAQAAAGNAVVPGAPLTPWANCDELIAFFFPDPE